MANADARIHLKNKIGKVSFITLFHAAGGFRPADITSISAVDGHYAWTCSNADITLTSCSQNHLLVKFTCTNGRPKDSRDPPTTGSITITLTSAVPQPTVNNPVPVTYVDDGT